MGLLELIQQKAFLGKEFLTWLWFRAETNPTFELSGDRRCDVEIMAPLSLDAHYGDARASTLRGESPATSPEAATALLEGKKISRARIKLTIDAIDWIASIDGETFNFSSLNLPKSGQLPFDEALRLRLEFAIEYDGMIAELLAFFLELRLDERAWAKQLEAIHVWADEK